MLFGGGCTCYAFCYDNNIKLNYTPLPTGPAKQNNLPKGANSITLWCTYQYPKIIIGMLHVRNTASWKSQEYHQLQTNSLHL